MAVQDNERERELVRLFNLEWDAAHQRSGVDALLSIEFQNKQYRFEVEVKSTTTDTVSTARDVGMEHINRWRSKLFVIGFYNQTLGRPELQRSMCLTPIDLEPWIAGLESKISIDFQIAGIASSRLEIEDLFAVCGEQETYSIDDAKRLHKKQWSALQYNAARDTIVDGKLGRISQQGMLEILRQRSKYISERGATLNNPHITASHLSLFANTDRVVHKDWAAEIVRIAKDFIESHPNHPSVVEVR